MPTALDELFMAESMTGVVRRFADQSADRSFISVYEAGEQLQPVGDTVKWDEVRYSRGLAPIGGPSSPSKAFAPIGIKKRTGELLSISEHVDLDGRFVMMARGEGSLMPDPEGVLNSNLQNLTNRIQRTRNYWAAKSLLTSNGQVDPGAFPNADLPSGAIVYTYPVRAQSASASWALEATKIRSAELNPLKRDHKRNSGVPAGVVIASDAVEGYITQNTEVTNLIGGGSLAGRVVETTFEDRGGGLPRFGGLDWIFARDFYTTDAAPDTEVDVISDADLIAVLPERARWRDAFAQAEGVNLVPTGPISAMLAGGSAISKLIATTRGWAAYVELIGNPIGIRLHVRWTGLLVQKIVDGVTVFNTTP
jgi:hypothetical protein